MITLNTEPLSSLLETLFAQAAESSARLVAQYAAMPAKERDQVISGKAGYREFYASMKDEPLAVSRETGALLYMLTRSTNARSIVEFGTSFGISTLHLAAGLRDNGGGRVITSEFEAAKVAHARANFETAGLSDLIEIREGDALVTLASGLPASIDLLLLDGAKHLYPAVLDLVEPRLRPGALLIADNADWCPAYLNRVRDPGGGYRSVPFGGDVEMSMRL